MPDWQPRVPLLQAVTETIEWLQRHNQIEDSESDPLEDRIIAAMRQIKATFA